MDGDVFYIAFQGDLIACDTVLDAVAVKHAGAILSNRDTPCFTPSELARMANVLEKYAVGDSAMRLRAEALRMRAAELVTNCGS